MGISLDKFMKAPSVARIRLPFIYDMDAIQEMLITIKSKAKK